MPTILRAGHRPRRRPTITLTNSSCTTSQGQINLCYNPKTFAPESCATTDVLILPFTVATTGQLTASSAGNSCETGVAGYFDAGDPTPSTSEVEYTVGHTIDFNSTTQTGDATFTTWTGPGTCKGATFVPGKGAKVINSGIVHNVVSMKGSRIDSIITTSTDVPNAARRILHYRHLFSPVNTSDSNRCRFWLMKDEESGAEFRATRTPPYRSVPRTLRAAFMGIEPAETSNSAIANDHKTSKSTGKQYDNRR